MSAFGKPAEDDDLIQWDDAGDVDVNPWYVPPGLYELQCTDAEKGIANSGNPKVTFTFSVLKAVGEGAGGSGVGKDLKVHAALTPQAIWKLRETVEALGMPWPKKGALKVKCSDFRGKKCLGTVEDNVWNGEKRSQIKRCAPLGSNKK